MATITNTFTKDSVTVTNTFDVAARGPVGPTGPVGVTALSSLTTVGYSSPNMLRVAAAGGVEQRTPAQVLADISALPASGNAVSATKLATARTIAGQPFDGTTDVNVYISGIYGLGANVAAALALPVGTDGAIQRQGDALTPVSIKVPDMTTVVPPSGAIGLKYGQLSLGDGAKMGGNEINPLRRIRGSYRFNTGVQPITGAFTRVAALPIFPTDIPSISNTSALFVMYGSIRFSSPSYYSQQIKDLGIGFCFNEDSLTAKSAGKWMYASAHPTPGTGTKLNFVDVSVKWFGAFSPFGFPDFAISTYPEVSCVGSVYSSGSDPVITYPSANSSGFPKVTSATSAKMWLMLHGEKVTGQTTGGNIDITYDLTLDFL